MSVASRQLAHLVVELRDEQGVDPDSMQFGPGPRKGEHLLTIPEGAFLIFSDGSITFTATDEETTMTPRQTSRQYQIDKRQEMLDEALLRQDAVAYLEAREAYDGASRDEPQAFVTTEDGVHLKEGDRAFSVYTMTWGTITNLGRWNEGSDPKSDYWFDFVQDDGKTSLLNGSRIASYKPAWTR